MKLLIKSKIYTYNRRLTHTITETITTTQSEENFNTTEQASTTQLPETNTNNNNNTNTQSETAVNHDAVGFEPLDLDTRIENSAARNRVLREEIQRLKSSISKKASEETTTTSAREEFDAEADTTTKPTVEKVPEDILGDPEITANNLEQMARIRQATIVAAEVIANNLQQHNINIDRTEEAAIRAENIYNRGLAFLASIPNPGRMAFYGAGTIALGFTVWNLLWYRQLPFIGSIGNLASMATRSTVANPASQIININYPSPLPLPNIPQSIGNTDFITGLFAMSWFTGGLVAATYILKFIKK